MAAATVAPQEAAIRMWMICKVNEIPFASSGARLSIRSGWYAEESFMNPAIKEQYGNPG